MADNSHWQTKYVRFDRHSFQVSGSDKITVLSLDGGGLRGVIPAVVLLRLEVAIKQYIVENQKALGGFLEIYDAVIGYKDADPTLKLQRAAAPVDLTMKPKDGTFLYYPDQFNFEIWLADFFDVFAGTSTGSIISTYLASRGEGSERYLETLHQNYWPLQLLRENQIVDFWTSVMPGPLVRNDRIWPGGALAILATFWAEAASIFPQPNIANKIEPAPVRPNYAKNAKALTTDRPSNWWIFWKSLKEVLTCKYSPAALERVLKSAFGPDRKLSDLKSSLLVPTVDLTYSRPFSFLRYWYSGVPDSESAYGYLAARISSGADNPELDVLEQTDAGSGGAEGPQFSTLGLGVGGKFMPGVDTAKKVDFKLWEVVRASTAAPTFFPVAKVKAEDRPTEYSFVDGGLAANNPTLQALTLAGKMARAKSSGSAALSNVAVLSLGTGVSRSATDVKDNAGPLEWVQSGNLVNLIMDGNASALAIATEQTVNEDVGAQKPAFIRMEYSLFKKDPKDNTSEVAKDAVALKNMDICEHVPRLTKIGRKLLGQYNEPRFQAQDRITNNDLLGDFVRNYLFGQH